jgi:hypothetical protein
MARRTAANMAEPCPSREVDHQLARRRGAALDECRVALRYRLKFGGGAIAGRYEIRRTADGAALLDAARVEAHHIPLTPKRVPSTLWNAPRLMNC